MYNVFGSGASHGIHAQFIAQSVAANNGRSVNLLRGAGTRFATWFYSMHRLLRLKPSLLATIHQPQFTQLPLNDRCRLAVKDIENPIFWKALYVLLRCVFPHLRFLRYCDSNTPVMDKLYFLCHRATESLEKSFKDEDQKSLFFEFGDDEGVDFELAQIFESSEGGNNANKGNVYCNDQ
jgi:hypothetical protein